MERFYPNLDLKFFAKCPICNKQYNPKETRVVDKKEGVVVLYFVCSQCKSAIVSSISAGVLGVMAVSMITDLSAAEVDLIKAEEAISSNDILAIYNSFKHRSVKQKA
jgi:transcription elongation factor Elf1